MSDNIGSAKAKEETKEQTRGGRGKKRSAPKKTSQPSEPSLNMAELRELANLVDEHGFTDFEFENANIRVRLSKNPAPQFIQAAQSYAPAPSISGAPQATQTRTETKTETTIAEIATDEDLYKITSPIVGTFYRSPSPDKEPYVKEGSNVSPDTIVCIVEAMKLMNEIEAEVSGEVVKIYVENGQPVEYGQPLFGIRK
ncbi:MAG: acetyl-CoA carboxylase biotin carboxyl carrier protein [Acidobacteria bacterium]|nr:acetyl-CoA carboxylase biotin carboxyl carrier protein [Acidobacteriota bacterium]MCA1638560.1 acetyl-CoA carboxylase biotin carboxyl carrier protein [Acidobacteriota bacterium]